MRLWSINPEYLDTLGLLALWRESLLAQKSLLGNTKGYKFHPQLERFKSHSNPVDSIGCYLYHIYREGVLRGYNFSKEKILRLKRKVSLINVPRGQIDFEVRHLSIKLRKRDKSRYKEILSLKKIKLHPLFRQVPGGIASWERVTDAG